MTAIAAPTNPIERSFELAAARCDDLTPLVYGRLHAERPETLTMFRTEGRELVKGSMLAMAIEAMLDFAGPRHGKFRMIECEVVSHDEYGTPRELFVVFFDVVARTLQDVLGTDWTAEMDAAWKTLTQLRTTKAFVEGYVFADAVAACERAQSTTPFKWNGGKMTAVIGLNSVKLNKDTVIASYTLYADGVYCDYDPIKKKADIGSNFLERETF